MDQLQALLLSCFTLGLLGSVGGYLASRYLGKSSVLALHQEADQITRQAQEEASRIRKEAEISFKEELLNKREELENEIDQLRLDIREQEKRLDKREDHLEEKIQLLSKKEQSLEHSQQKLADRKHQLEKKSQELEELHRKQTDKLHEISQMSRERAEEELLCQLEKELSDVYARKLIQHQEKLKEECDTQARRVLAHAIHRYAAQHTADTTVSSVDIPSDDMKGRIIGREGRNIRTFEKCTGVDVIVDDTPGVVIVSAFDNVRRETARLALQKLIQDGRIHPTRIEEVVQETQQEMEKHILEVGRKAVQDANIRPLHEKLVQLLGRLKFRTSYSQNVLQHSLEVAHLTGMLSEELGLDSQLARRCGLLHDIGKAADHEMEGGHPQIGAELARRHGESSREVLHAISGHHDDVTLDNIYTVLVATADAISAARPGARRETLEKYVKRLEELETVASGFPGVDQVYAIQAGREVRVIVNSTITSDSDAVKTCHEIARAIEEKLHYPGEIKVTVVRETRAVDFAR